MHKRCYVVGIAHCHCVINGCIDDMQYTVRSAYKTRCSRNRNSSGRLSSRTVEHSYEFRPSSGWCRSDKCLHDILVNASTHTVGVRTNFSRGLGWATFARKIFRQHPKKLLIWPDQIACCQRTETVYIVFAFYCSLHFAGPFTVDYRSRTSSHIHR